MIDLRYKPNEFMENTIFKESIRDVDYAYILAGLDIMELPSIIEQVKA